MSMDTCHIYSGDDPSTADIMVGFLAEISEFTSLNCAQQASITTQISLTVFAVGQHCQTLR